MKDRLSLIVLLALMAIVPIARAEEPAAPAQQNAKPEEPDVICKNETVTGSRLKKRVCTTRAQRDAAEAQSRMNRSLQPKTIDNNEGSSS